MGQLAILLQILTAANASTPLIVALIAHIKGGQEAGKTDDEIIDEGIALAMETRAITEADMQPTP